MQGLMCDGERDCAALIAEKLHLAEELEARTRELTEGSSSRRQQARSCASSRPRPPISSRFSTQWPKVRLDCAMLPMPRYTEWKENS